MIEAAKIGYGRVVATSLPFAEAVTRVKERLKEQQFGVLCEIDVAKTLREKIGAAFRPYIIIGACNPPLAHRALSAEPQLGLLLPCNVVVQEKDGRTLVSAIDAHAMLGVVGNPALEPVAEDAGARLNRVLDQMAQL
jgi:uncharacterized protein (DUF302 family)